MSAYREVSRFSKSGTGCPKLAITSILVDRLLSLNIAKTRDFWGRQSLDLKLIDFVNVFVLHEIIISECQIVKLKSHLISKILALFQGNNITSRKQ